MTLLARSSIQYVIYLPFSARMGFHGTPEGLSRSNRFEIRLRASLPSFRTPSGLSNAPPPPSKQLRKSSTKGVSQLVFTNRLCQTLARYLYLRYFPSHFASYFRPTVIPPFTSFLSNCCPCVKGGAERILDRLEGDYYSYLSLRFGLDFGWGWGFLFRLQKKEREIIKNNFNGFNCLNEILFYLNVILKR